MSDERHPALGPIANAEALLDGVRRAIVDALVTVDCNADRDQRSPEERRHYTRQCLLDALRSLECAHLEVEEADGRLHGHNDDEAYCSTRLADFDARARH